MSGYGAMVMTPREYFDFLLVYGLEEKKALDIVRSVYLKQHGEVLDVKSWPEIDKEVK